MPKIGSIIFATDSGLGILARDFYRHGVVTDVMVVRHGRHENHTEWYPGAPVLADLRRPSEVRDMEAFCGSMDAMLFFETPFRWELLDQCRRAGVPTALMTMYECSHERPRAVPDAYLCPSLLDLKYFTRPNLFPPGIRPFAPTYSGKDVMAGGYASAHPFDPKLIKETVKVRQVASYFTPVPVEAPWRLRTRAEVFVHNAGHGGLKGRNGTAELMAALPLIKSDAELIIRSQESLFIRWQDKERLTASLKNGQLRFVAETVPYETLWKDGDVLVFPEAFNGLSLPLQEARAAGLGVMCGDRFPMNTWLPRDMLLPVAGYRRERVGPPYHEYDRACFDPRAIAAKIDEVYGMDLTAYSEAGREWAETMSWDALGPRYKELLADLMESKG